MKSLISCSVVTEDTLSDIPRELEVACHTALPVVCVQTKSIEVLKNIYELDLLQYFQLAHDLHPQYVESVATFLKWMQLKVRFEVIA